MANEITTSIQFKVAKLASGIDFDETRTTSADLAGTAFTDNIQTVTDTPEPVDFGDVVPGGLVRLVNLDGDFYVTLQVGSGGTPLLRMLAGETHVLRFDEDATGSDAPHLTAQNNKTVRVRVVAADA
jgi:hypothetical protein